MSTGATVCSSCGYENVVFGCGFCLQCGEEFPASTTVEKETSAQESQVIPQADSPAIEEGQPAASEQESPAASAPNTEAVLATVAHSSSQYVGAGDSTFPADEVIKGFSVEPSVPAGGTEAFQAALLAAEENDGFFQEAASPGDDPIFAAAEADERSQQQPENVVLLDEPNDTDEHTPLNDEANEPIVEAFEPTAETSEPAVDTFEFEPEAEAVQSEVEVFESVDEIGEPSTESREPQVEQNEPEAEAVQSEVEVFESVDEIGEPSTESREPQVEQNEPEVTIESQSGEEIAEGIVETFESGGEVIEGEKAIEPNIETDERTVETIESVAEIIDAGDEASEPGDEPSEQTVEGFESIDETIEPGIEALEAADAAIASAIDAFQPATETSEQPDEVSDEVKDSTVEPNDSTSEASDLPHEAVETVETSAVVADDSVISGEPLNDPSEADVEPDMITETAAAEDAVETDTGDEAETADLAFADALFHELDRLITTGARSIGLQLCATELGMSGELEIDGREQKVYVQRNYNSTGTPMVSLFASCGPASQQHAVPLLEWNSALSMCAFAIRNIENTPTFVTQANLPAFSLDKMTIAATIKEIAKRADQVKQRIG